MRQVKKLVKKVTNALGEAISKRTDTRILAEIGQERAEKKLQQVYAARERRAKEPQFMQTSDGKMMRTKK